MPNRGESAPRFGKRDERILVTRAMVCSCFGPLACRPKSCSAFSPQFQHESPISLTPNRYLGAKPPDLACSTAGTAALLRVAPTCIFLMPGHFYLGALLLCTFMVMVMLCACREACFLVSARELAGET